MTENIRNTSPVVGSSYLWDFGGTSRELITVYEVREEVIPSKQYEDGSHYPGSTRITVRIGEGSWIGWYGGRNFELVEVS